MSQDKVSVIIPTYNRGPFLEKAVNSVLAQSCNAYEIIVIDDGSDDDTRTRMGKYDSRIRYIYQENRGPSAARNRGIEEAQSPFLAFLDSDDLFQPEKIKTQLSSMQQQPDYLISHTDEIWYRRGKLLNQKKKHHKPGGYIFVRCLEICAVSMSTVMVRRELFDDIGMFDETLPCCEDYDLWLRASIKYHFLKIDVPLTIKNGGRTDEISYQFRVGMDKYRIASIRSLLKKQSLTTEQISLARKVLVNKAGIYGNGCLKHGRLDEAKYYLDIAASVI